MINLLSFKKCNLLVQTAVMFLISTKQKNMLKDHKYNLQPACRNNVDW